MPIKVIVPGGLNTDIIASQVSNIAGPGELVVGKELKIGPGGKSRNIAQMIAVLLGEGEVAMIGRTAKDPLGLWNIPMESLRNAGVNIKYIKIGEFEGKMPGVALIPVDQEGNNQIYLLPGVNDDFSPSDLDDAEVLFKESEGGILALSLEMPLPTVIHAMELAAQHNLRIVLDPGE